MRTRIAVTGATSDFAAVILPVLLADPDVESVVGIARSVPRVAHDKLESVRMDIRSPELEEAFRGCDVVVHLAFVVEEMRNKAETHDINLRGSRNVIDAAYRAGVRRVVVASSVNAYGPELRPKPVDESAYPAGDPDRYYFHDKAEVEHYAEWWLRRHPGEMTISLLRSTYVVGPHFSNDGIDQLTASVGAFPRADEAAYQFLHERDLADAFHRATTLDLVGPFNIGPPDWVGVRELAAMQGQRLFDVPERPAVIAANIAFRLGLSRFSGQWITAGETVVDSTRFAEATGWRPMLTAHEAAALMVLFQGKGLLRKENALTRHVACEAALEPSTAFTGVDTGGLEHVQVPVREGSVHLEVHPAGPVPGGRPLVIPVPEGLHARYLTAVAKSLSEKGFDVVLMDLPGHGLSTGPRGRLTAVSVAEAVEAAVSYARNWFGGSPVVFHIRGAGEPARSAPWTARLRARITGSIAYTPVNPSDPLLPRVLRGVDGRAIRGPGESLVDEIVATCAPRFDEPRAREQIIGATEP
ncbi:NAD-dependent epimerase/dehydratase family protein [Rhodococcus sp. ABRD24]|uniref:NAD-dependent epimerase/dehydratase family protein n=1 Tax=Rhodococcus sp. ABRD24 TaxID=2507582 RepID=UPI001038D11F|nr:NAD-dependent epimerase/dehydratase family protein [Rhodococcus sp. ABRD24]QBJ96288.1 NAD-dependent epimerase/dehydratase family protein [Rhodococcus sp. ABRD24]